MQKAIFMFAIFGASLSLAETLRIQVSAVDGYEYDEEFLMTASKDYPNVGDVVTIFRETQIKCTGFYIMDWRNNNIRIEFDGLNGRGSTGGCHNESLDWHMDMGQYMELLNKKEVDIVLSTQRFYRKPLKATISRLKS